MMKIIIITIVIVITEDRATSMHDTSRQREGQKINSSIISL